MIVPAHISRLPDQSRHARRELWETAENRRFSLEADARESSHPDAWRGDYRGVAPYVLGRKALKTRVINDPPRALGLTASAAKSRRAKCSQR